VTVTTSKAPRKATVQQIQNFFGKNAEGKGVDAKDLMALKRAGGYDHIAVGIADGTLTY
jgi:hypothetical protein